MLYVIRRVIVGLIVAMFLALCLTIGTAGALHWESNTKPWCAMSEDSCVARYHNGTWTFDPVTP